MALTGNRLFHVLLVEERELIRSTINRTAALYSDLAMECGRVMACGHRVLRGSHLAECDSEVCARGGQGGDLKHSALIPPLLTLLAVLSTPDALAQSMKL